MMIRRYYLSNTGLIVNTIVFIVFMAAVLPYMASLSESMTHTAFSPDTASLYPPELFYEQMAVYGEDGRDFYILSRWTFDILWPLVYTGFFISTIAFLSPSLPDKLRNGAFALPLLSVAFDLFENTWATINVAMYPNRSLVLLRLLQGATILKWIFILLTFSLIILLCVLHVYRKLKGDR